MVAVQSPQDRPRIALIYSEPTTYMLSATRKICEDRRFDFSIFFWTENISAPWHLSLQGVDCKILLQGTMNLLATLNALVKLLMELRNGNYGLVMVGNYMPPFGLPVILLCMVSDIPWVLQSDTQLLPKRSWVIRTVKRILLPLLLRSGAHFLPYGSRQKDYFIHYGVPEDRITKSMMTVDTKNIMEKVKEYRESGVSECIRRQFGFRTNDVLLLFVGRLVEVKGCEFLLRAIGKINKKYKNVYLMLAGDGEQRYWLESMVHREKIENVIFLGYRRGDDLLKWYSLANIFVLPSWNEPWGLVINEAMAAGLPIVATTAVGSIDDLVVDGENGFVIKPKDIEELVAVLENLVCSPELASRMGTRSRAKIKDWNPENYAIRVLDVFDKIARNYE